MYKHNILTSTDEAKLLGIKVDLQLTWRHRAEELATKLFSFLYPLKRIATVVSEKAALSSDYAFVESRMRYDVIFWGNLCHALTIFKPQKSCLRAIYL